MAKESRKRIKTYFQTGDQPTENEFINVFDSTLNLSGSNAITGSLIISGSTSDNADGSAPNLYVMGDITSSGNILALGDVIARNYIVSSSVTNITTQTLSGSTEFGNSTVDRFGCVDSDGDGRSDPNFDWSPEQGADAVDIGVVL